MEITNYIILLKTFFNQIQTSDILLALLGLFIFSCIHNRLTNKGPMMWPVIGTVPSLLLHFHEIHDWITKTLVKSGGSYRVRGFIGGLKGIVIADPIKVEYILKTKFKNFPKGKFFRERFEELLGDGIFNSDDDKWKEQRRIATSEMHTSRFLNNSLRTMQSLVHNRLLKVIEKQVKSSKDHSMDLQELLLRFTFDSVCEVAFGIDPGCIALDLPDIPFAKAFEEATEYSSLRFLAPPYLWKAMRFFNMGREKKLKDAVNIVHKFAETTVKNRKADLNKPGKLDHHDQYCDLLSRLIKMNDHKNSQGISITDFSDKFLKDFCISFILAGRDTSSVALVWLFWLLHEHPYVETKILHEIHAILSQREIKGSELNEIVFLAEELDKMTYLQAALSESLRLYPPVPVDFKQAKEDDVFPDGMRIPKDYKIIYHVYAMGRLESVWGDDCLEFRPERWLKDGQFVSENQFKYVVFNAGPRLCVGKKFSYTQMKMVAASILLRYRVKVVDGQVIAPKVTTTLYMKHGLQVTFQPRQLEGKE